jgi:hypothetical protein
MAPTAAPDIDTARRILAPVPHARRFPVGHLRPPTGLIPSTVRSLGELEFVLAPRSDSLPGVHMERLAAWIEHDVGDPVGAAEVRDAAAAATSYVEACLAVYERVRDRVASARLALESAPQAQARERRA